MNKFYFDENTDRIYTIDEIRVFYEEFKDEGETFAEYLNNCTDKNGSLTAIETEFDEFERFVRIAIDADEDADEEEIGHEYKLEDVVYEYLYRYDGGDSFDEYTNRNFGIKF